MNTSHLSDKISELWPRLSDEHIGLICKRVAKLDLDHEQVTAALEAEWERPANKVPPHERIIRALRNAAPKVAPQTGDTAPEEFSRLKHMRRMLNAPDWPVLRLVGEYYIDAANRSIRLYGHVQEYVFSDLREALMGLAGKTADEADALVTRFVEKCSGSIDPLPDEKLTDRQRKAWAMKAAARRTTEKLPAGLVKTLAPITSYKAKVEQQTRAVETLTSFGADAIRSGEAV